MQSYLKDLKEKLKESMFSILPFFLIIVTLYFIFIPFNIWALISIILATVFMIFGMALFNIGVDMSTMKMGGYVGSHLSKSRKITFMIILSFVMGFIVTIAEPDLMVLSEQVQSLGLSNKWVILITVSSGTGIFLILSTIRTLFRWSLKTILIISYSIALILSLFAPINFLPLSFDTIGVTTGAVSVPFIMSFGLGISAVRSGKNNQNDGFGLIALASIGPVIAILLVSLFLKGDGVVDSNSPELVGNIGAMGMSIGTNILSYIKEVFIVIIPIFIFFIIYNYMYLKLPKTVLLRIFIGLLYTYLGLVVFLTGVSLAYLPTANVLGKTIADGNTKWLLIPLGLLIGFFLVFAEPAVHVLNKQVEDITEGVIKKKTMLISLSIGVSIAMLIIVFRVLFNINFMYICIPLILIMIILSIFTPDLFEGIAFDSGGVAAGSLTASFVLPFIIGVCNSLKLNAMLFAFGAIAIVAIIPTIIIQIIGIRYKLIINKSKQKKKSSKVSTISIIEFE